MRARLFLAAGVGVLAVLPASTAAAATGTAVPVTPYAVSTPAAGAFGGATIDAANEIDAAMSLDADSAIVDDDVAGGTSVDRGLGVGPAGNPPKVGAGHAKSDPQLGTSYDGLNFNNQRFANGGNQFSVEPPDQGLCAGNGYVMESVNDVLRIWDASGNALTGPVDLNTFYGYAPAINRGVSPLRFGPSITDPSCYYDSTTQRWFQLVLTLDRAVPTSQGLSGANHLDIAVSNTSSPLGSWTLYHVPVQNDGTQGTPDHHCVAPTRPPFVHGPCLGDYPHIGADRNGFYVSTNEFDLAGPFFHGAQVYAISKAGLESGGPVAAQLFDTAGAPAADGNPGFTVWPAQTPGDQFDGAQGGTEWLLSSNAVFSDTGLSSQILQWQLSNTASLNSASPAVQLTSSLVDAATYGVPGSVPQKAGSIPLGECAGDPVCASRAGASRLIPGVETRMPSNDSRMQQVMYANGKLWGALDTGLAFSDGSVASGIAWYIVNPHSGKAVNSGYLGDPGVNYTYPAVGVTPSGRGVIAFTTVGTNDYPSAGYAGLDAVAGAGPAHVAQAGAGPQDGFSGYRAFVASGNARPRWGDYGAAAVDGNDVWVASEYVGQTCTFAQYNVFGSSFGTCGGTRGALGNWDTRISRITP